MALTLKNGKSIKIIDRTIVEVKSKIHEINRLELIYLFWMINNIGADVIEISSDVIKKLGKLPVGIKFLLRIDSWDDIEICQKHNIKYCLIDREMFQETKIIDFLDRCGLHITLEYSAYSMDDLYSLKQLRSVEGLKKVNAIRINGLNGIISPGWVKYAKRLGESLNVEIDICPENRFYNANALAVETIMGGLNSITCSFSGFGGDYGFSALEEVMVSAKILVNPRIRLNLNSLPKPFNSICENETRK